MLQLRWVAHAAARDACRPSRTGVLTGAEREQRRTTLRGGQRAAEQLSFRATVDLEEGIRQLVAWRQEELHKGQRLVA